MVPIIESVEKVGIPECEDYLAKYETCVSNRVPEAALVQWNLSLVQTRKAWHGSPGTNMAELLSSRLAGWH